MTTCPKCGYSRKPEDTAPEWQCPECGVAYAKVVRATPPSEPPAPPPPPHAAPKASQGAITLSLPPWLLLGIGLLVGGGAGWIGHGAYVQHQIATALSSAATALSASVAKRPAPAALSAPSAESGSAPQPAPLPPPREEAKDVPSMPVALLKKGWRDRNYKAGLDDAITVSVDFTNPFDRDIRAFEGVLQFNDMLGNEVYSAKLVYDDGLKAHETKTWEGEIGFNQFIDRHRRLRNLERDNAQIAFRLKKVLFADGETQEY